MNGLIILAIIIGIILLSSSRSSSPGWYEPSGSEPESIGADEGASMRAPSNFFPGGSLYAGTLTDMGLDPATIYVMEELTSHSPSYIIAQDPFTGETVYIPTERNI